MENLENIAKTRQTMINRGWEEIYQGVYVRSQALRDSDTFNWKTPISEELLEYLD